MCTAYTVTVTYVHTYMYININTHMYIHISSCTLSEHIGATHQTYEQLLEHSSTPCHTLSRSEITIRRLLRLRRRPLILCNGQRLSACCLQLTCSLLPTQPSMSDIRSSGNVGKFLRSGPKQCFFLCLCTSRLFWGCQEEPGPAEVGACIQARHQCNDHDVLSQLG